VQSSSTSLIYRHPLVYEALMRCLYGSGYSERYRALAELIPEGASVLDVCCGPATLFHRYLKRKAVRYTGLDINPGFIGTLCAKGGTGIVWNLEERRALPSAEYVIMQASLYHFLPDASFVIESLHAAAEKQVLIAEPVRNMADSRIKVLAFLARRFTNPGTGDQPNRFNEKRLDGLLEPYRRRGLVLNSCLIAGGREKLYVLDAAKSQPAAVSSIAER
jgi:SAM-dependent methyltransferase